MHLSTIYYYQYIYIYIPVIIDAILLFKNYLIAIFDVYEIRWFSPVISMYIIIYYTGD